MDYNTGSNIFDIRKLANAGGKAVEEIVKLYGEAGNTGGAQIRRASGIPGTAAAGSAPDRSGKTGRPVIPSTARVSGKTKTAGKTGRPGVSAKAGGAEASAVPGGNATGQKEVKKPAVQDDLPELKLDMSKQSMLNAFVFSEILGRPRCKRRGW